MKLYRLLTGEGDAVFCKKISEALNKGWELYGSPAMTFDAATGKLVAGQAVVKEVEKDWQTESAKPDFRLGSY
jgi:hypothetical protein